MLKVYTYLLTLISLLSTVSLSAQFVENKGQVMDMEENIISNVKFFYGCENTAIYFEKNRVVYSFITPEEIDESLYADNIAGLDSVKKNRLATYTRMDMVFHGADPDVEILSNERTAGDIHYYLNKRNGIRDIGSFENIIYKDLYDGIDVKFYQHSSGLKYDFILSQDANIADIQLEFQGAESVTLEEGRLMIHTKLRDLQESIPLSFINGDKGSEVQVSYSLDENGILHFSTDAEDYESLTIDPVLEWATYYNNTAATTASLDYVNSHLDASGNYYINGQVYSAANNYPVVNPGSAYTAVYSASSDVYIAKFNASRTLVWATYLGGSSGDNSYGSESITSRGNTLHVVGERISAGAPFMNGGGYYNTTTNKVFWSRFNLTTGALQHLTTLGGGYGPSVAVSGSGQVAIIMEAYDFSAPPIMNRGGAFNQGTNGGSKDMYLFMTNSSYAQIWGTFLGGPAPQENFMCRFDNSNNLFFIGETSWFTASTLANENIVTLAGAYNDNSHNGGTDVLLGKFTSGGSLVWNTMYGGDISDARRGQQGGYAKILIDPTTQQLSMFWNTTSTNLPTLNGGGGAYYKTVPTHASFNGSGSFWNYAAYFARFTSGGALSHASYYYNSTDGDLIHDVTYGGCNKLYIIGRSDPATFSPISLSGGFNLASGGQVNLMQMNRSSLNAEWLSSLAGDSGYGPTIGGRTDNPRVYAASEGYGNSSTMVNPGGGAYYNASNINGTSANLMIWQLHPTNPPNISGVTTVCSGQTTTLIASGGVGAPYSWFTASSGGSAFYTGATYNTPSLSSNTTYYVSSGSGLCISPRTAVTVTINAGPTANAGPNRTTTCTTPTATLNGSGGGTYSWNNGAGAVQNPVVNPASTTTYTLTVNVAGCTDTDQVLVTVNETAPTANAGPNRTINCTNTTATLNGSGGGTYSWNNGAGATQSPIVSPGSNTTYTLTVTGTNGCTDTDQAIVTIDNTAPTANAGPNRTTTCTAPTATLNGSGGGTYAWNNGAGAVQNPVINPASNTTYTLTVTSPNGCTDTDATIVTVDETSPVANAGPNRITTCTAPTATLNGSGGGTYSWNNGGGATQNPVVNPAANTTYTLIVTGTNGCTDTDATVVTVNETAPTANAGPNRTINCTTTDATLNGSGGGTYSWNNGAGAVQNPTVIPAVSTTYTLTVTGTNGCTDTDQALVTLDNTPPSANAGSNQTINCTTTSATLNGSGGGTYSWNNGAGAVQAPSVTPVSTTTYTLTVTGTNGCTDTDQAIVTVDNIVPSANAGANETIACGSSSAALSGSGGGSYSWTPAGSLTGASTASPTSSATSNTTYTLTVTSGNGCTDTDQASVTVNTNPTVSSAGSNGSQCQTIGTYTLSGNTPAVGTGAWAQVSGPTSSITTPASPTSGVTGMTSPGTYVYEWTISNSPCTASADQVSVVVNATDNGAFSYSGGTYCLTGSDPTPTITGLAGGTFSINNGGSINTSTGEINLTASGVNSYTVSYLTNGPCPTTVTAAVSITSAPTATFSYTGSPYCSNGSNPVVTFAAGASGGVFSDFGATGNLTINGSTGEIDLSTTLPGTYTVENDIVAAGGCAAANATTSITITLADDAGMSYSGSTYCLSGTDPTPVISGTSGGAFTSTPAGLIINGTTGEITLATSAVNTYDVTYTSPNACFADSTVQITVTSAPTAGFSYPNTLYCQDNGGTSVATVLFTAGSSGGVFTDQGATGDLTINSSTGEIDLALSVPGTYIVENNIVAAGGCAAANAAASITITTQDDPSFNYSSTSFCEGDTNPLATITGTSGGSFTSIPAGLVINSTTGEVDVMGSTLDITYTITYTTTGTCPDSQDATLIINSAPTVPTVTTSVMSNTICLGESIDIVASGSGTSITYNVYDAATGGTLLGATDLTVSPIVTTNYYVEAVNTAGCAPTTGRELVTITVNPLPSIDAGTDETICPGDIVTLTATGTGMYSWSTTETTQSIDVSPVASTTYTVTLTDANSCVNSDQVDVNVNAIGAVLTAVDDSYNVDFEVLTNLDVLGNDIVSTTITTILIDPINGMADVQTDGSIDYTGNAGYTGSDSFTYIVCESLCATICDTANVSISVENNDLEIPGGFSPNDDNINDIFVINGLEAYANSSLQIYNRWGGRVFNAQPYNNDWDGSSSEPGVLMGDKVTSGTYFFILDLGDGSEVIRGSIEVKWN